MKSFSQNYFPQRIICMTEESVEFLFDLGLQEKIIGVSTYVKRPLEAKKIPTISAFTHANLKKIQKLQPDLVLGFSDIQKDIAKDLIGAGLNVYITNQRSLEEIFAYIYQLGHMLGAGEQTIDYVAHLKENLELWSRRAELLPNRPRVYLEEWDEPMISGIQWFCQLAEAAGAEVILKEKSFGSLAKDRFVTSEEVIAANPQIILGCWCGKKVETESFAKRIGWEKIEAVQKNQVFELEPEIFLQPGPALFKDGIEILVQLFENWSNGQN